MKKYVAIAALLLASPALAQTSKPGKQIVLSQELVEALFQRLSQDSYASVAPLLAKMQAEIVPQLAPAPAQPTPTQGDNPEK